MPSILKLIRERKTTFRDARRDGRSYNTKTIETVKNSNMNVLRKRLLPKKNRVVKTKDENNHILTGRDRSLFF